MILWAYYPASILMSTDWRVCSGYPMSGIIQAEDMTIKIADPAIHAVIELLNGLIKLNVTLSGAPKEFLIGVHVFLPHCLHCSAIPTALFLESYQRFGTRLDQGHWEEIRTRRGLL